MLERGRRLRVRKKMKMETEVREERRHYTAVFEGVGRGREPRTMNYLQRLGKARTEFFPRASRTQSC